jgi:PST family polysaccharide transporter
LLQRRMQFGRVATIEVASSAVGFATALTVAWHGGRYWALVAGDVAYQLASSVSIWFAARWMPGLPVWAPGTGALLRFGAHLTGSSFLNYWLRNTDNLLIGRYRGATELGLYDKAYQLLMMPLSQVHLPLSGVCIAGLSRLLPDPAQYRSTYRAIAGALALVAIPSVALLAAVSEEFITFLLGADWRASGAIYRALGPAAALQTVSAVIPWLLVSQGRARDVLLLAALTVPLTVLAFVVGLPWGAKGVAFAYSTSEILRTIILFSVASRTGPVPLMDHYRALLPGILLGAVVYGAASFARQSTNGQPDSLILLVSALAAVAAGSVVATAVPALRRTIVQYVTLVRRLRENRVGR